MSDHTSKRRKPRSGWLKIKSGSDQNSPKMRIFSLAKVNSGSELKVEEAEEESTCQALLQAVASNLEVDPGLLWRSLKEETPLGGE